MREVGAVALALSGFVIAPAAAVAAVPPVPAATTVVDATAVAKDLYSAAERLYAGGAYDDALVVYRLAYEARPDPIFLFDIAQCFRLGGKGELALSYYREFLKEKPDAPNRADVEAIVHDLEALVLAAGGLLVTAGPVVAPAAAGVVASAPPPSPVFAAPAPAAPPRLGVLAGTGIGLTVAGGALLGVSVWSASRMSAAGAAFDGSGRDSLDDFAAASDALGHARDFARLTAVLVSAGAAALATGATLVLARLLGAPHTSARP
jgi:tetratricopeptide (TPR) repeat protein